MKAIGLGDRPNLGRLLGARDLALGAGLLLGRNTAAWWRARGIAEALLEVALTTSAGRPPEGPSAALGVSPRAWASAR